MAKIKTVVEEYASDFDVAVQTLLDEGYKLQSSNCGLLKYCDGSSDVIYQAILLKED